MSCRVIINAPCREAFGVIKRWFGAWSGKNLRPRDAQSPEVKWVQQFYFAKLGEVVIGQVSPPAGEKLEELEPEEYFANVGYDGTGLRVPADLDEFDLSLSKP